MIVLLGLGMVIFVVMFVFYSWVILLMIDVDVVGFVSMYSFLWFVELFFFGVGI